MANDNTIDRQSLNTSLEQRYSTSKVGGAYDAKKAGTSTEDSVQAAIYDNTGKFVVKQAQGQSNFKGTTSNSYKEISKYSSNLDTKKYR